VTTAPHSTIDLQPIQGFVLTKAGRRARENWPKGVFRFRRGQNVWVRDTGYDKDSMRRRGYRIVPAKVRERHYHPDRHPAYPQGEGYALDGELWWDCYPGCRVFATREEAIAGRLSGVH
jgi:hypothetical protein